MSDSRPILDGVRVVDLTQYLAGPTVTRMMAEQGADIVKVEQAPGGDPTRALGVVTDGRSGYFIQQNRGKRSLCIDFRSEEGLGIVRDLVARADVVVENYGPGVLEKRGLDYPSVKALNPTVVMVSVSAFGRTGMYSGKVGYDLIAQAFSGLMHMTGERDGPPQPVGVGIGDVNAGVHAFAAVGMALYHRERTGEGQHVDISMVDALFHQHELNVHGPAMTNMRWRPIRSGHHSAVNAPQGVFKAPQGWIVLLVLDRQWGNTCRAIGRPELEDDPRFDTLRNRKNNREELVAIIEEWMATFDTDEEVMAVLEKHRVPAGQVLDPADAISHPYFRERDMIRDVPDPILGSITIPGDPMKFGATPDALDLVAPLLGEHNREILVELGYEEARIEDLAAHGILVSGDR
jgi:crotonobetainyl-CoA:carnitine CoA-transferase CaiB-like acyl-CoA transferase